MKRQKWLMKLLIDLRAGYSVYWEKGVEYEREVYALEVHDAILRRIGKMSHE